MHTQVNLNQHMRRSRYYIAPRMHRLLSAVAAARRQTVSFQCETASAHAAVLRGCQAGSVAVVPTAALLELASGATFAMNDRSTSTALTDAVLPRLQPAADLPPVLMLTADSGAMTVTEPLTGAVLLTAMQSKLERPTLLTYDLAAQQQRVTALQRIVRASFGAAWASSLRSASLVCVASPGPDQSDGFVTYPGHLASAINLADAGEASSGAEAAIAVAMFLAVPAAGDTTGVSIWARGDASGQSQLDWSPATIAALQVLYELFYSLQKIFVQHQAGFRYLPLPARQTLLARALSSSSRAYCDTTFAGRAREEAAPCGLGAATGRGGCTRRACVRDTVADVAHGADESLCYICNRSDQLQPAFACLHTAAPGCLSGVAPRAHRLCRCQYCAREW